MSHSKGRLHAMSKKLLKAGFVVGVLACVCLLASDASARERPAPRKVTLTGMVSVTKDDAGALTAVKLTVKAPAPKEGEKAKDDIVYNVTLDDNGKKLGELNGKKAEVVGTVTRKMVAEKPERWLTVESSKEVVEATDKPAGGGA